VIVWLRRVDAEDDVWPLFTFQVEVLPVRTLVKSSPVVFHWKSRSLKTMSDSWMRPVVTACRWT